MILALINIPLGMKLKQANTGCYIAYGVWVGILVIAFSMLIYMKQEEVDCDKEDFAMAEVTATKK
jgi:H+/gluconate symporter-like permease